MRRDVHYRYPARLLFALAALLYCVGGSMVLLALPFAASTYVGAGTALMTLWVMGEDDAAA